MKDNPYFSVIMPVFNGEEYLSSAIESVLQQTFDDFELILVDDCSLDQSFFIAKKYAEADFRIAIMQTDKNNGVANARNYALSHVHGKYLTFVDADDYIENDVFALAYQFLQKHTVEFLKYGCIEEYYDQKNQIEGRKKICLPSAVYTEKDDIRKTVLCLEELPMFGYLWNTFYLVDLLQREQVAFDPLYKINEDFMFNLSLIGNVQSMGILDYAGYHYAKRIKNSLSTKENREYYFYHINKINDLLEKYAEWNLLNGEKEQQILWLYTRGLYSTVIRSFTISDVEESKCILKKIYGSVLFSKYKEVTFNFVSVKQMILIKILQHEMTSCVLLLCWLIFFFQTRFRVFFAKIKK